MAVLELGQIGGRPSDRLAERLEGQAGLAAEVAEAVAEHQGIEGIGRHHVTKVSHFFALNASYGDI